jgi:hypothetical protein
MSYGKDERHLDKHLWKLPIPVYNEKVEDHRRLAELGQACSDHIAAIDIVEGGNFVGLRRMVRAELAALPAAIGANELVELLIDI